MLHIKQYQYQRQRTKTKGFIEPYPNDQKINHNLTFEKQFTVINDMGAN